MNIILRLNRLERELMKKTFVLSENILKLIIEGKVKVIKGKKLKYGKYRIVRRYVVVRR